MQTSGTWKMGIAYNAAYGDDYWSIKPSWEDWGSVDEDWAHTMWMYPYSEITSDECRNDPAVCDWYDITIESCGEGIVFNYSNYCTSPEAGSIN